MYLTFAGMEKVAQISQNPQAIKNREAVLILLKQEYAALCATMHVQAPVAPAGPVAQAQVSPEMDVVVKKRQIEREDALFEMEIAERKQRLMQLSADTQIKVLDVQKTLMETYKALCPNMVIDDRARLMFKDNLLSIASQSTPSAGSASSQLAIGNGANGSGSPGISPSKPITIGRSMASNFRGKYNREPPKHKQYVKGNYVPVNSYMERDCPLMEQAVRSIMDGSESESSGM